MKIKKDHYNMLKNGMKRAFSFFKQNNLQGIKSAKEYIAYYENNNIGIIPKDRACYDLLRISTINEMNSTRFICDILYPYMNDNHLNTALNKIMNEI